MMEWQPIETAPKNPVGEGLGPHILLWNDHSHEIFHGRWRAQDHGGYFERFRDESFPPVHHVTHWMPLPNPPKHKDDGDAE